MVAYSAQRGEECRPVVGSKFGESFGFVDAPVLAGGRAFFHVANTLTAHTEHHWVWCDGKLIGPEDWIDDIAVSPDGSRIAYWSQPGAIIGNTPNPVWRKCMFAIAREIEGGKWSVTRGPEWIETPMTPPIFSADGQTVFTCGVGGKGWVLLSRFRKEVELSDPCPMIDSLAVSRDGTVQAFVRTLEKSSDSTPDPGPHDGAELYFQKVRVGKGFPAVARPAVDAAGKHVAFVVIASNKESVVVDGEKKLTGIYDHVFEIVFDPTGRRLAFVANVGGRMSKTRYGLIEGGESFLVMRDVSGDAAPSEHPHHAAVEDLCWDPKGERIAYRAQDDDGWRIVCGAVESEPHDEVGAPRFDGDKLRFGTRDKRELWWREMRVK
jgi:hypothetical protein